MSDSVLLAYVHDTDLPYSFFDSHRRLVTYDQSHSRRMTAIGEIGVRYGTGGIVKARNEAVVAFLKLPAEWLLWIDTDMGFAGDTIDQLVDSADPVDRPVMGGLCFSSKEVATDGMGGKITFPIPTVFDWFEHEDQCGFVPRINYERDAVIQVSGTGSACILIHRTVFEVIRETHGDNWYTPLTVAGREMSEDLSFCRRATDAGFPVHINTAVKTTHCKRIWLGEWHFDIYRKALGEGSDIERQATGIRSS